jgi:hypothetical protein
VRNGGGATAGVDVQNALSGGCSSMAEHQLPKLKAAVFDH